MILLDNFFSIRQEIHDYFGYQEDWVTIPLYDGRDYYWYLNPIYGTQDKNLIVGGDVVFADTVEDLMDEERGAYYSYQIYTQRFLSKWVYEKTDYTMISVDTHIDGNKYLMIFDNTARIDLEE